MSLNLIIRTFKFVRTYELELTLKADLFNKVGVMNSSVSLVQC